MNKKRLAPFLSHHVKCMRVGCIVVIAEPGFAHGRIERKCMVMMDNHPGEIMAVLWLLVCGTARAKP